MRLNQSNANTEGAPFSRLGTRQRILIALVLAGLIFAAVRVYGAWKHRRGVYNAGYIEPPADVIAHRNAKQSPFVEGLEREEFRERIRKYGSEIWLASSGQEKIEVARGFFPDIAAKLKLTPEQQDAILPIYERAIAALIEIWDGWWQPNFGRAGAIARTWLLAGQVRMQVDGILDAEQKRMVDAFYARAREESDTSKDEAAKPSDAATTITATTDSATTTAITEAPQ